MTESKLSDVVDPKKSVNETLRKSNKYLRDQKLKSTFRNNLKKQFSSMDNDYAFFDDKKLNDSEIMQQMRNNITKAGSDFMNSIRKADLYAKGINPKKQAKMLQDENNAYAKMMVLACMDPISKGISVDTVLQSAGMGVTMWLMSRNFRQEVGSNVFKIRNSVLKRFDGKLDKKMTKAIAKSDKASNKGKNVGTKYTKKWLKRYQKAQTRQRGGMEPFTPHSAAMTSVALMENAYMMMRKEGAKPDEILKECNILQNHLYKMAYEDGIEASDIDTMVRVVCRARFLENPELFSVFKETAHGDFIPVVEGSDLRDKNLFFSMTNGFDKSGSLSVRVPSSDKDHWDKMHDLFTTHLNKASNENEVIMVMGSYSFVHGAFEKDDIVIDNDSTLISNVSKLGNSMIQSMIDDGISPENAKSLYMDALMTTIDEYMVSNDSFMSDYSDAGKKEFIEYIVDMSNNPYKVFPGSEGMKSSKDFKDKNRENTSDKVNLIDDIDYDIDPSESFDDGLEL